VPDWIEDGSDDPVKNAIRVLLVDPRGVVTALTDASELSDFQWTTGHSTDALSDLSDSLGLNLGLRVLERDELASFEQWKAELPSSLQEIAWLVAVVGEGSVGLDSLSSLDVQGGSVASPDLSDLRRSILYLAENHRLSLRNGMLEEQIEIMESCQALAGCLEFDQLYPELLDLLLAALSRSRGLALFSRDSVSRDMAVALRGFSEGDSSQVSQLVVADDGRIMPAKGGVHVQNEGPLCKALRMQGIDVESVLVMKSNGTSEPGGLVAILQDGLPFREGDLEKAAIVSRHAHIALENATVYASAKEHAFIDDVTSAYNVRYFMDTCEKELRRSGRYSVPLSLLFLDLDQFKRINEEFGHVEGSQILNRLCRLLEKHVRQVDTLARYGGDEFAILLVDTDHVEALAVAERIRVAVQAEKFLLAEESSLDLTVSVGVATCPGHGVERDEFIDAADRAMFQAKASGRNCIYSVDDLA
jgi:diguanylate cyclase (GGDEF)-like protein